MAHPNLEVVQTSSVASNSKIASAANSVITPTTETNLKRQGVIIEHSFSDGTKWRFRNITGHAVGNNDIAIADTATLPQFINFLEKELEKKQGTLSSQTLSLNPMGCAGYFWWWCINPVSNYLWTTKTIPYQFASNVTPTQKASITSSIERWNAIPSLTVKWKNVADYNGASTIDKPVTIGSVDAGSSYCGQAFVGYQGRVFTSIVFWDFINLNNNPNYSCFDDRTIHHEMGHVVGLPHEQKRCDRDAYVTLAGSGVEPAACGDPTSTTWGRGFDFSSLMLYDTPSVTPKRNTANTYVGAGGYLGDPNKDIKNVQLSTADIQTINDMYEGR